MSAMVRRQSSPPISSKKANHSSHPLSEHATRQKGFTHETQRPFDIRNPRPRDRGADCRFCGEYDYGAAANVHGTSTAFLAHDADSALGLIDRNDVRVDL